MATRKKAEVVDQPPLYDPAQHTDPNQMVFVELYCRCGAIWRQRDPVSYVEPQVRSFLAAHAGEGHEAASKADCVAEREARREAAFRLAGQHAAFEAKTYRHLDTTCTAPRPWPVFPDLAVEG